MWDVPPSWWGSQDSNNPCRLFQVKLCHKAAFAIAGNYESWRNGEYITMEHWNEYEIRAEYFSPGTDMAKYLIEYAWNEGMRDDFWKPECGMMPENPVEYYSNGDGWDRELQDYDNCLSCLCGKCQWNLDNNSCDTDSCPVM